MHERQLGFQYRRKYVKWQLNGMAPHRFLSQQSCCQLDTRQTLVKKTQTQHLDSRRLCCQHGGCFQPVDAGHHRQGRVQLRLQQPHSQQPAHSGALYEADSVNPKHIAYPEASRQGVTMTATASQSTAFSSRCALRGRLDDPEAACMKSAADQVNRVHFSRLRCSISRQITTSGLRYSRLLPQSVIRCGCPAGSRVGVLSPRFKATLPSAPAQLR